MFQPGRFIKQQEEKAPRNPFLWLLTFTDVMALMLTFFVLLFSMSQPKNDTWSDFVTSLGSEFNTEYGGKQHAGIHANQEMSRKIYSKGLNLDYLSVVLSDAVENSQNLADVKIEKFETYIKISLPSDVLFAPGQAVVTNNAKRALNPMMQIVKTLNNQIELHGHADPAPIETSDFPSNWALSLSRAMALGGYLNDQGYDHSVKIVGQGDKSAFQLPPEMEQETRYRLSRRVDLIIHEYRGLGFSLF